MEVVPPQERPQLPGLDEHPPDVKMGRHEGPPPPLLADLDGDEPAEKGPVDRVVTEHPARPEDAGDLGDDPRQVPHVFEDVAAEDGVAGAGLERDLLAPRPQIPDPQALASGVGRGGPQRGLRRVEPPRLEAQPRDLLAQESSAAAQVQGDLSRQIRPERANKDSPGVAGPDRIEGDPHLIEGRGRVPPFAAPVVVDAVVDPSVKLRSDLAHLCRRLQAVPPRAGFPTTEYASTLGSPGPPFKRAGDVGSFVRQAPDSPAAGRPILKQRMDTDLFWNPSWMNSSGSSLSCRAAAQII